MKTYKEVAEKTGLDEGTQKRYIAYMTERWASSESVKCQVGYATEWALRFKHNEEYVFSDSIGQEILNRP